MTHEHHPAPDLRLPRLADDRPRARRGRRLHAAARAGDRRHVRQTEGDRQRLRAHRRARPVVLAAAASQRDLRLRRLRRQLFTLRYDAPGDPALAARIVGLLRAAGIDADSVDQGGLDHGAWTALRFLFPAADIPIVPLAFVPSDSPAKQFALGEALAPLTKKASSSSAAAASPTTCAASSRAAACIPTASSPRSPRSAPFAAGSPTARGARLGRALRLPQRARRTPSTCIRPTSTCCRDSSPPVPAAARRRRCACTTARRWAASAWTPMPSGPPRVRSPTPSPAREPQPA